MYIYARTTYCFMPVRQKKIKHKITDRQTFTNIVLRLTTRVWIQTLQKRPDKVIPTQTTRHSETIAGVCTLQPSYIHDRFREHAWMFTCENAKQRKPSERNQAPQFMCECVRAQMRNVHRMKETSNKGTKRNRTRPDGYEYKHCTNGLWK